MSLQAENAYLELRVELKFLKLLDFGFKLKSFISMLSWTGMILSIFGGLSSLIPIIYPLDRWNCSKLPCGLPIGWGAFCLALAIIWFCLSFFLRKKNNQKDVTKVVKILKIICCFQGFLAILYSVLLVLAIILIGIGQELDYILYPTTGVSFILAVLMIIGVVMRKPKLLTFHIILTVAFVVLFIISIIGLNIYKGLQASTGLPVIYGLLASMVVALFSFYWLGFVMALQTIMKKMK